MVTSDCNPTGHPDANDTGLARIAVPATLAVGRVAS
jgi:hypothetical protein